MEGSCCSSFLRLDRQNFGAWHCLFLHLPVLFFFIIIFLFSLLLLPSSLLGCVFLPPFCVQCWEWVHDIAALRGTAPAARWWWLEGGPRTAALTAAPQRTRCLLRASMRNGIFLFQTGIDSLLTNENICCWILSVFV